MTPEELDKECKENEAWLRENRMNRKKFDAKCRVIMASEESGKRKAFLVRNEAEHYMDNAFHRFPECREIAARQTAVEERHAGTPERPTYCLTCGTWSPAPPIAWVGLCRDWARAKKTRIENIAREVLKRKAA